MTRGVVVRPDPDSCARVRAVWDALADAGLPSLATHRKAALEPHLSLTVADHLEPAELTDLGLVVPPLTLSCAGVFPGGVLHLVAVPDAQLLAGQAEAHRRCVEAPSTRALWSYYRPGAWTPHVTLAYRLSSEQVGRAMDVVLPRLPLALTGPTVELEDADTGETWPLP